MHFLEAMAATMACLACASVSSASAGGLACVALSVQGPKLQSRYRRRRAPQLRSPRLVYERIKENRRDGGGRAPAYAGGNRRDHQRAQRYGGCRSGGNRGGGDSSVPSIPA